MSATGVRLEPSKGSSVNAIDLSSKMGITLDMLSRAAHAKADDLTLAPQLEKWQPGLRTVANLWEDLTVAFGGDENARRFLNRQRPELMDQTPLYYLQRGEPEVVHSLVHAMREFLP